MSLCILEKSKITEDLRVGIGGPLLSLLGWGSGGFWGSPHLLFHCPAGSRISNRVCGTKTQSYLFPHQE